MRLPFSNSDNPISRRFYEAGNTDDVKKLKSLIEQNEDVRLDFGFLSDAARRFSSEFFSVLLGPRSTSIINEVDSNGWSALEFAVSCGRYENAKLLLDAGADPDCNCLITGALNERNQNPKAMIELLLKHGADINQRMPFLPDENLMTLTLYTENEELISFVRSKGGLTPEEMEAGAGKRGRKAASLNAKGKPAKKTKFEIYSEQVIRHFSSIYGEPDAECVQEIVSGGNFPLEIRYIPYNTKRKTALLFTVGMGLKKIRIPRGEESFEYAELAISLPREWPPLKKATKTQKYGWPIQWMFNIANYIHGEKNWLNAWTVIANGSPPKQLAKGVKFAAWGSYIFESEESIIHLENGNSVGIFFLIPLYLEEYAFEQTHGLEKLMKRFGRKGFPLVLDLERKNVCS